MVWTAPTLTLGRATFSGASRENSGRGADSVWAKTFFRLMGAHGKKEGDRAKRSGQAGPRGDWRGRAKSCARATFFQPKRSSNDVSSEDRKRFSSGSSRETPAFNESQAVFECRCGFRAHAAHNAAINILRRNTASMRVEEGHWLSGESRTGSGFAPAENPPASAGDDVKCAPMRRRSGFRSRR